MMDGATADAEAAATRINQDQLISELESKCALLKANAAALELEGDFAMKQKAAIGARLQEAQVAIANRDQAVTNAKQELDELRIDLKRFEVEAEKARAEAKQHLTNVQGLQHMVNEQSRLLMETQGRELKALQKAADQEALVEPLRHTITRLNKQIESGNAQSELFEMELANKTKLIQELREKALKTSSDLKERQTRHAEEVASLIKQLESSRQSTRKVHSSLFQAEENLKEVQASRMHEDERVQKELSTQRKLADLYKKSADEAVTEVNKLQELSASLEQSLAEAKEAEQLVREQLSASERHVVALQLEIQEAKEDLQKNSASRSDIPSTGRATPLVAMDLSPEEWRDKILALEEEVGTERYAKDQLAAALKRVVDEVRKQAPILKGLEGQLARSKESYEACKRELENCRAREHQAVQDRISFQRQCDAQAKSIGDLSSQVQHLLFRPHETSQRTRKPGEIASENLVVFKDVKELQIRNQQLLITIRELTEAAKKQAADKKTQCEAQMLEEIEELRNDREKESKMITEIIKQRDNYRALLVQANKDLLKMSEMKTSAHPGDGGSQSAAQHSSEGVGDAQALQDLQTEFHAYQAEQKASLKIAQDALEHARTENWDLRLALTQYDVESKNNMDCLEAAEKRVKEAGDELARVRVELDQAKALVNRYQKQLADSETKLNTSVNQTQALEEEKSGLLREISMMKKNEDNAIHELATLRLDNSKLVRLVQANSQSSASREDRGQRECDHLMKKVAVLESKLQESHETLASNKDVSAARIATEEKAKTTATVELEQVKDHLARSREQIARLEVQLATSMEKNCDHENVIGSLREQLRKGVTAAASQHIADLEDKLRQSQRAVESTVDEIKSLKDGVTKYKTVAEAHEKTLAALQDEHNAVQGELQKARAQLNDGISEHKKPALKMEVSHSEVQRRLQRSARFSITPAASAASPGASNLKRSAVSAPDTATPTPLKMARLNQTAMEQPATASETASDQAPLSSPPVI